jgi:hypothetical protein
MRSYQHASTTSLEKTGDRAQHTENSELEASPNRPEALKDMSEAELAVLEKKIVRKMDSIIL